MGKQHPDLDPDTPFHEAAHRAIDARLADLFKHEEATRAGADAEALHDMRVASRRLRSAMDIFAICFPPRAFRPLRRRARTLTRALGAVRDSDVLLEQVTRRQDTAPPEERAGVAALITTLTDERTLYRRVLLDVLDKTEQSGFRRALEALPAEDHRARDGLRSGATLRRNAVRIAAAHLAEVYDLAPAVYDVGRAAQLHALRIAAKRLRYVLEILRPCFGDAVEARIEDLKRVQDQIGQIHDGDVLAALTRRQLSVLAQQSHEALSSLVAAPVPHEERMARLRAALAAEAAADPRPGLLALLGQTLDERLTRYAAFVAWWEDHERAGLRAQLNACITGDAAAEP